MVAGIRLVIRLVTLKQPCSACVIIQGLIKDALEKTKFTYPHIEIEYVELEHINQAAEVQGLEVEKFPALIINGEQYTAGSLVTPRQLIEMLRAAGMEDDINVKN